MVQDFSSSSSRYTKALDSIKALRKDRVAELKAEKERLESLSREKSHADKLKGRVSDLHSTIAAKEVEYDETKKLYDSVVEANQKFYDYATKFRELYLTVQNLQDKKARYQSELEEARLNVQEVVGKTPVLRAQPFDRIDSFLGTDEELDKRLRTFDEHIGEQKKKKRLEDTKKQDFEDELVSARKLYSDLLKQHGVLTGEAQVSILLPYF